MATEQEPVILALSWGESGTALGLKVTFNGGTTVTYGPGKPPAGSVTLVLAHGDEEDTVAWMESDWGDPHEAFGYTYRVLNAPELKPRAVRVEVRRAGAK
jgi:hypothetical protein